MLDDGFLNMLVTELDDDTAGVALTGSHARDDATRYSDVDLLRFVDVLPESEAERYTLRCREGYLVSITTTTVSTKLEEFARPQEAIWTVSGLRQSRILLDKDGSLRRLKQAAEGFTWEPLQDAADEYASYSVMGDAEEVHKVLGGMLKGDESTVVYGTLGLCLSLTKAILVQRCVLLESENSYFSRAQDAVGRNSEWACWLRLSVGLDEAPSGGPLVEARGVAGLRLYEETVRLLQGILRPEHRDVIENALAAIRGSGVVSNCPRS